MFIFSFSIFRLKSNVIEIVKREVFKGEAIEIRRQIQF